MTETRRIVPVAVAILVGASALCVKPIAQAQFAPEIKVTGAPVVSRKDLNEAASLAYVAKKLGLNLSLEDITSAVPTQTTRPDLGWVPGFGLELKALPAVADEFGMTAVYRPGLSLDEAAALIKRGYYVIYRCTNWCLRIVPESPVSINRAIGKASTQMIGKCFSIVLLDADGPFAKVYDPYLGVVTLPPSYVDAHSSQPYGKGRIGYSLHLWDTVKYEAVVIGPTIIQTSIVKVVKLASPELMKDEKTGDPFVRVKAYLGGRGNLVVNGHWVIDGKDDDFEIGPPIDFTKQRWQSPLNIQHDFKLDALPPGPHALRLVIEGPTKKDPIISGEVKIWASAVRSETIQLPGLEAKQTGPDVSLGAARLIARSFDPSGRQVPSITSDSVLLEQVAATTWIRGAGMTRLTSYGGGRFGDRKALVTEADLIQGRLSHGKPAALALLPSRSSGSGKSARGLVAVAGFSCEDAADPIQSTISRTLRSFAVYDPTALDAVQYLHLVDEGQGWFLISQPGKQTNQMNQLIWLNTEETDQR